MKLSVIICTYNRANYIPGLFKSLVTQTCDKLNYEIVFVNNNSKDNTEEICKQFQIENKGITFKYFNETKQGLSFARNRGIKESTGEILVFIDDDAIASENYLIEILTFFEQNQHITAGGGRIFPKYETKRPNWMSVFLEPIISVINIGNKNKKFPAGKFPVGANMFFRKIVFDEIGLFNTMLGRTGRNMLGGEEKDIFNRLKNRGALIFYLADAWIYHIIPENRLTQDFIKKQATGIGISEKIRARNINSKELFKSYFKELFKWAASLILFLFYLISFQALKAMMIVKFRYWVSSGLYNKEIL